VEKADRDAEQSRYRGRVSRGERVEVDKGTLELDEGVLFKREKDGRTRVAVPVMIRDEMLRSMHEDVRTGGHFGARKAMKRRDAGGVPRVPGVRDVDVYGVPGVGDAEGCHGWRQICRASCRTGRGRLCISMRWGRCRVGGGTSTSWW